MLIFNIRIKSFLRRPSPPLTLLPPRGSATEQPGAAAALRGDGGLAEEDEGGTRLPQLPLPGGPGPGGEAGPGEPLPAGPGQRAGCLIGQPD